MTLDLSGNAPNIFDPKVWKMATHQLLVENDANVGEVYWNGGDGTFLVRAGTWGGGSVKLQVRLPNDITYNDVGTDTSLTADGGGNFSLGPCYLKVLVTTATGVYAEVKER